MNIIKQSFFAFVFSVLLLSCDIPDFEMGSIEIGDSEFSQNIVPIARITQNDSNEVLVIDEQSDRFIIEEFSPYSFSVGTGLPQKQWHISLGRPERDPIILGKIFQPSNYDGFVARSFLESHPKLEIQDLGDELQDLPLFVWTKKSKESESSSQVLADKLKNGFVLIEGQNTDELLEYLLGYDRLGLNLEIFEKREVCSTKYSKDSVAMTSKGILLIRKVITNPADAYEEKYLQGQKLIFYGGQEPDIKVTFFDKAQVESSFVSTADYRIAETPCQ